MAQIAAEEFGISVDRVRVAYSDSAYMPYDQGTVSSRATYHSGNAVRLACQDAKRQIFARAGQRLDVPPDELETSGGVVYRKGSPDTKILIAELFAGYRPGRYGVYTPGGEIIGNATFVQDFAPEGMDDGQIDPKLAAQGKRVVAFYSHAAKALEVAVNVETGEVKVIRCVSADDMGQPIDPKMCEQQQESGLAMGIGAAIYEEVKIKDGLVLNPNFADYRVPSVGEVPTMDNIVTMIAAAPHKDGPYGAKGFGEQVMLGVDAAIANAVYNAVGVESRACPLAPKRCWPRSKRARG